MAISYDNRKKSYDSMDDSQKQQYNDMLKNKGDDYVGNQYMKQYNQQTNNNQQQTSNESNFNNGNGTNGQNQTQTPTNPISQQPVDMTAEEYRNSDEYKNSQGKLYEGQIKSEVSPDLDQSKFNEAPGQITVKEGTAAQTGKPDYTISTDARLNEMKGNLDQYFKDSPRMFSDRETFNRVFDYNGRESEAQRQLLDSYWKRKQDIDNASKYTSGDGIESGMKDADITTDQLNYIKENSPEAYREWQQKQQDEINLRIANLATPADPTDNAELFNSLVQKLGLEPNDPYQIYDNWYSMCERLGVFSDSEKLKSYQNQLDQNHSKMESIMSRYAASTGGTVSDALAAARMQKALAPYQQREVDLQNSYTTLLNGRNSNLAVANQSATALAMQAQEDQRVWNQRYQALGFAMTTASYRSPEQQAQLQLQTASIQNDLNLLNQSKLNDLNRYNAYATAKMQNQLQQELTDLSVEDEAQLKANLNNVLSSYYSQWGDIIKRPQAEVVEDVLAYAQKNGVSVAEALRKNFIEPLQNKDEYKQKVASDYGMLSKQTITTINGKSVIMTTNPNGSISYQYIEDPTTNTTAKPYDIIDSKYMTAAPVSYGYNTLGTFLLDNDIDKKINEKTKVGQCGKFVNDYLESIGFGRYYDNELSTKLNSVNSDQAVEGGIAVFDYGHKSSDGINHGHVGIITKVYDDGSFDVVDANYDVNNPETLTKRHINAGSPSFKGCFDMSKPPRATSNGSNLSTVDAAKKENYLEEARRGQMTNTDVAKIGNLAAEQGWGEEWREALKQGMSGDLTETQIKRMDKEDETFNSNPLVKEFTEALNQYSQLVTALNDSSGVGDMSAIFTFMKTLDPSSVVRESEFQSAANTAGVLNRQAIYQNIEKSYDGKFLTAQQRKDFQEIAKEFIKIKAKNYQTQYDHLANRYKQAGIDINSQGPANLAEQLLNDISGGATGPEDQLNDIYASAMNNAPYTTTSYGGYETDFINMMINSKM